MRTDNEQFEKITGDYEAHAGKMKMRKRVWTIVIATVLVVAMVVSSVLVIPGLFKNSEDAPIAEAPQPSTSKTPAEHEEKADASAPSDGSEYYIVSGGKKTDKPADSSSGKGELFAPGDAIYEKEVAAGYSDRVSDAEPIPAPIAEEPIGGGDYYYDDPIIGPDDPYPIDENPANYQAGQLTGAEIKDRAFYQGYLDDMRELLQKIYENDKVLAQISAQNRIKITVKDGETPLSHVKVELFASQSEKPIWTAVTDNKGEAFLFYNVNGKDDQPAYINYQSANGVGTVSVLTDGKVDGEVIVEIHGENGAKKLDLMFMIDTTGSMGDELEYLKAEISDIIARINNNGEYPVRTSVNFYRDEGDQYVVHATPFTTNVDEVLGYIGDERSMGGGDYPEAVHTALDNAVNGHNWDENAEKLLFVVLDAPPHSEQEVAESLYNTMVAAAAKGIRVIPIVSSGSDSITEYLMRTYAVLTGGTYTFLTDHSGIGNPHADPTTGFQYEIEMLNSMIVRIAKEYLA